MNETLIVLKRKDFTAVRIMNQSINQQKPSVMNNPSINGRTCNCHPCFLLAIATCFLLTVATCHLLPSHCLLLLPAQYCFLPAACPLPAPCFLLPAPCSLLPAPCSCSLLLDPCCLLTTCSLHTACSLATFLSQYCLSEAP